MMIEMFMDHWSCDIVALLILANLGTPPQPQRLFHSAQAFVFPVSVFSYSYTNMLRFLLMSLFLRVGLGNDHRLRARSFCFLSSPSSEAGNATVFVPDSSYVSPFRKKKFV